MVLVADDAHRVAGLRQLSGGLLALEHPGAGGVDDLEALLALDLLVLRLRDAVGADDERAALDLVREVGGPDAAVGEIGLDAGVVHQLAERGDLLALGCRVLGLVDREPNAVAEAGALGDADVRSGCGGHRVHSRVPAGWRPYMRIYAPPIEPGAAPPAAAPR